MKFALGIIFVCAYSAMSNASCVDLTGSYSSPLDPADQSVSTTFIFTQNSCAYVSISTVIINGGPSQTHADYLLDGSKPHNCLMEAFNNCGTLKMTDIGVEKIDPKASYVGDADHGLCTFDHSLLIKDGTGNLVETFESPKCEDGYTGNISPRVYLKK